MTSLICGNRKRLAGLENELMVARGERWKEGIAREFGIDMFIRLYLKWITNVQHRNSAQCYVAAWMGKSGYMYMDG